MLLQYLEKQGLREHEIAQIIKVAIRVNSGRQRWFGLMILISGLAIVSGCFAWINLEINGNDRSGKALLFVAFWGLIISIGGLVRMVTAGGHA
jgi:hypothetical protein